MYSRKSGCVNHILLLIVFFVSSIALAGSPEKKKEIKGAVFSVPLEKFQSASREEAGDLTLFYTAKFALNRDCEYFVMIGSNFDVPFSEFSNPELKIGLKGGLSNPNFRKANIAPIIIHCSNNKPKSAFSYKTREIYREISRKYNVQ